jgi:hypothetical protein
VTRAESFGIDHEKSTASTDDARDATVRYAVDMTFAEWVAHLLTVWRGFYPGGAA